MTKLCGIYLLTHIESGRKYVGQSVDIHKRFGNHSLGRKNTKLGNAVLKYGWASFTTEIIELCVPDQLNALEMQWVKHHDCIAPSGFNLTSGGSLQTQYSLETREKISAANRLRVVSDETKIKLKARIFSEETRKNMSKSRAGRSISDAHRAALLEAAIRCAPQNIARLAELNRGRKRSEEQKACLSAIHTGSKRSVQTRAKMSAAKKGKLLGPQSAEQRANTSAALMGHKLSDETRAKIGARQQGRKHTQEHIEKAAIGRAKSVAARNLLRQNATIAAACDKLPQVLQWDQIALNI